PSSIIGNEFTEDGIEIAWGCAPGKNLDARWLIVLNPNDDVTKTPEWAAPVVGDGSALLVMPRGSASAWTKKNPPNTIERDFPLLGATVDSGRVWDILTVARRRLGTKWKVAGSGNAGILG